jgi:serine protease Do
MARTMPFARIWHKLAIAAMTCAALGACSRTEQTPTRAPATPVEQSRPGAPVGTVQLPSFVNLVKLEGPAVVNVSTTRTIQQGAPGVPGLAPDDPAAEFFRRFLPPGAPREFQAQGLGSGFIISQDGYVLTNAHVVAESEDVTVRLTNKREYKAKVIGFDLRTDVALIKIDAGNLPMVHVGDPNKLEVGEWVAAIGAPFGFENSVTAGIVSAKGRTLPEETYVPFIQTDVALNPGNSGGPLFNMQGEVIGINSQIYSQTGGYMGLSFAIPIDIAMDIVKQLRAGGKVVRGRIGVQAQELTADLAASFGLKEIQGALVALVEKGGPADKAGILPGDVILRFDGKPVNASADLARLVGGTKPGSAVTVDLWRKGAPASVKLSVAELRPERLAPQSSNQPEAPNPVGLVLRELTLQQRTSTGVEHGLVVNGISGLALQAGIQRGDVVLAVNDVPVRSRKELDALLAERDGATVALLIRRGPETLYLPLKAKSG